MSIRGKIRNIFVFPHNSVTPEHQYNYSQSNTTYPRVLTDDIEFDPIQPDHEFNFDEYSKAIVNIINGSQPKFSVGIYGEWGAGKTTLMELIENRLNPPVFNWKKIPADQGETEALRQYLIEKFQLNWIKDQKVKKATDHQTIEISNEAYSSSVSITEKEFEQPSLHWLVYFPMVFAKS